MGLPNNLFSSINNQNTYANRTSAYGAGGYNWGHNVRNSGMGGMTPSALAQINPSQSSAKPSLIGSIGQEFGKAERGISNVIKQYTPEWSQPIETVVQKAVKASLPGTLPAPMAAATYVFDDTLKQYRPDLAQQGDSLQDMQANVGTAFLKGSYNELREKPVQFAATTLAGYGLARGAAGLKAASEMELFPRNIVAAPAREIGRGVGALFGGAKNYLSEGTINFINTGVHAAPAIVGGATIGAEAVGPEVSQGKLPSAETAAERMGAVLARDGPLFVGGGLAAVNPYRIRAVPAIVDAGDVRKAIWQLGRVKEGYYNRKIEPLNVGTLMYTFQKDGSLGRMSINRANQPLGLSDVLANPNRAGTMERAGQTSLVVKAAGDEGKKISLAQDINPLTEKGDVRLKSFQNVAKEVIDNHRLPNADDVTKGIYNTLYEHDAALLGSTVQYGVGKEMGQVGLTRIPRDFDVHTLDPKALQKDLVQEINKRAGKEVVVASGSGVKVRDTGEKLFDIHKFESSSGRGGHYASGGANSGTPSVSSESIGFEPFLSWGAKTRPLEYTDDGILAVSVGEQAARKIQGGVQASANTRTVGHGPYTTGNLVPAHDGRVKDIGDYYNAVKLQTAKMRENFNPVTQVQRSPCGQKTRTMDRFMGAGRGQTGTAGLCNCPKRGGYADDQSVERSEQDPEQQVVVMWW